MGTSQYYGAKFIWNRNGIFSEPTISRVSKLNFEEVSMTSLLLRFWIESIICEKKVHFKKKPYQYSICKWINLGIYIRNFDLSRSLMQENEFVIHTYNKRYLLYHIKNSAVLVQPHIMVRYGHCLKSNFLGIFEKRIWPPNKVEPFYW